MKKLVGILLLVPLLLASCSIDWNGEKDVKIAELEKKLQDDTFKKKQDCYGKKNEILDIIGDTKNNSLYAIFYSPVRRSCIYAWTRRTPDTLQYYIDDLFTSQSAFTSILISKSDKNWMVTEANEGKIFHEKIKELKGE